MNEAEMIDLNALVRELDQKLDTLIVKIGNDRTDMLNAIKAISTRMDEHEERHEEKEGEMATIDEIYNALTVSLASSSTNQEKPKGTK